MKLSDEDRKIDLIRDEIYYIRNMLQTALDDWADRKISDAKFYGLIRFRLDDLETLREDLKIAGSK